jgi:hypothetical protein
MGGNPVRNEHEISYRDPAGTEKLAAAVAAGEIIFDMTAPAPERPPRFIDEPMVVSAKPVRILCGRKFGAG